MVLRNNLLIPKETLWTSQLKKNSFQNGNFGAICFLVCRKDYMCSVDLSDTYYSLLIHTGSCQNLCFKVDRKLFHFTCLPNGYHDAPCLFTKILKVPLAKLQQEGTNVLMYLDDSWLGHENYKQTYLHVKSLVATFQRCGFIINVKKSVLSPVQVIETLGFILDSRNLTLSLPEEKCMKHLQLVCSL